MSLKGYVYKQVDETYQFMDLDTLVTYPVKAANSSVQEALQKLADFDTITGFGSKDSESPYLTIETIDFVALRRLLGQWKTDDKWSFVNFEDYTRVVFRSGKNKAEYKYAIAPSPGASSPTISPACGRTGRARAGSSTARTRRRSSPPTARATTARSPIPWTERGVRRPAPSTPWRGISAAGRQVPQRRAAFHSRRRRRK